MAALGSVLVREARPSIVGFSCILFALWMSSGKNVTTVMKQTSQEFS